MLEHISRATRSPCAKTRVRPRKTAAQTHSRSVGGNPFGSWASAAITQLRHLHLLSVLPCLPGPISTLSSSRGRVLQKQLKFLLQSTARPRCLRGGQCLPVFRRGRTVRAAFARYSRCPVTIPVLGVQGPFPPYKKRVADSCGHSAAPLPAQSHDAWHPALAAGVQQPFLTLHHIDKRLPALR